MYTVAGIWRYPIKSMQGEPVDAAHLDARGMSGDRGRALIDAATGKVASGAWRARRWADLLHCSASYLEQPRPDRPVPEARIALPSGRCLRTDAPGIDAQLSRALERDVRLATAGQESDDVMYGDPPPGTFRDVAPLHVLTTGTLARLAELAPMTSFDARRFRPNLVIDTAAEVGFVEDQWLGRTLTIGGEVCLRLTSRCPRCVMTTHAQGGLPKDAEVLRSVARSNHANVGIYAEVAVPGTVHVGAGLRLSA